MGLAPDMRIAQAVDPDSLVVRYLAFEPMGEARLAGLARMLDDGERAYAARLKVAGEREAYVAAHALVRATLSSAADVAPSAWRFQPGEHGKPRIAAPVAQGLSFNLSHARGMVAVAMSRHRDVGVDVERMEQGKLTMQLADQMFAPAELALCRAAPPARLTDALYDIWTLKEAYIKADGGGFTIPLQSFAFTLDPPSISFDPSRAGDPAGWLFRTLRPAPTHALAFAMRHPRPADVRMDVQPMTEDALLRLASTTN